MKINKHLGWLLRHPIYGSKWHLRIGINNADSCDFDHPHPDHPCGRKV